MLAGWDLHDLALAHQLTTAICDLDDLDHDMSGVRTLLIVTRKAGSPWRPLGELEGGQAALSQYLSPIPPLLGLLLQNAVLLP